MSPESTVLPLSFPPDIAEPGAPRFSPTTQLWGHCEGPGNLSPSLQKTPACCGDLGKPLRVDHPPWLTHKPKGQQPGPLHRTWLLLAPRGRQACGRPLLAHWPPWSQCVITS